MINCPVQNSAILKQDWIQVRPRISQNFGENPAMYKQFGLKGHNGVDFGIPEGTPLFAPFEGIVHHVGNEGDKGYGRYIKLRKENLECVLAHLSMIFVPKGKIIRMGERIALSGDTGFSTGPHLHFGMRFLENGQILNYDNGYHGYVDCLDFMICWKGTFLKHNL